jgi:hypothetical protein
MKGTPMRAALKGAGPGFAIMLAALVAGCAPLIADYSLEAYKNATSLKAETAALIDQSEEAYANHKADVQALTTKINAAYEFAAGIPDNMISTKQWDLVRGDALYGGFVKLWAQQGTTSFIYRAEKKRQLGQAYDYIICLEVNKQSATSCTAAAAMAAMGDAQ